MTNRDAGTGELIDHMPNVKAKASIEVILVTHRWARWTAPTPRLMSR